MPVTSAKGLSDYLVDKIREFHKELGIKRAELDVSGGVDSATMLGLLAQALGPENVTAAYSSIQSSNDSRVRARLVAKRFNVNLIELDLNNVFDRLVGNMLGSLYAAGFSKSEIEERIKKDPSILGSIRSTLRAPIGRGLNRMTGNGIRHGTGNECEDRFLRFYQKGGDGEVDTNPLGSLSKGEVLQLARFLGVPEEIVMATPTPDLWAKGESHNDEDELRELTGVEWTYSRISMKDGQYTKIGTIELVNRFLDERIQGYGNEDYSFGEMIFNRRPPTYGHASLEDSFSYVRSKARRHFRGFSDEEIKALLASAIKIERQTRHKENPNIPTLVTRYELVTKTLITDELPYMERN